LRHVPCDLSDSAELERGLAEAVAFLRSEAPPGKVLLINNSGYGVYGRFSESPGDQVGMLDVNARAPLVLTAGLLPEIRARGGVIVNVASVAAFLPTPHLATYSATKSFLLHWSLCLDNELRGSGVRTLALCPGPTSTDFFKRAGLKEGAVPDAFGQTIDEVVRAALRAIERGRPLVVSGWKNRLLAAFVGFVPKPLMTTLSGYFLVTFRKKRAKP
jgi:hypothetical protein